MINLRKVNEIITGELPQALLEKLQAEQASKNEQVIRELEGKISSGTMKMLLGSAIKQGVGVSQTVSIKNSITSLPLSVRGDLAVGDLESLVSGINHEIRRTLSGQYVPKTYEQIREEARKRNRARLKKLTEPGYKAYQDIEKKIQMIQKQVKGTIKPLSKLPLPQRGYMATETLSRYANLVSSDISKSLSKGTLLTPLEKLRSQAEQSVLQEFSRGYQAYKSLESKIQQVQKEINQMLYGSTSGKPVTVSTPSTTAVPGSPTTPGSPSRPSEPASPVIISVPSGGGSSSGGYLYDMGITTGGYTTWDLIKQWLQENWYLVIITVIGIVGLIIAFKGKKKKRK